MASYIESSLEEEEVEMLVTMVCMFSPLQLAFLHVSKEGCNVCCNKCAATNLDESISLFMTLTRSNLFKSLQNKSYYTGSRPR